MRSIDITATMQETESNIVQVTLKAMAGAAFLLAGES